MVLVFSACGCDKKPLLRHVSHNWKDRLAHAHPRIGCRKPPAFASVATLNSRRMSVVTGCSNFGRRMMWANLTTNSVHAKVYAALQFDFNQKTIQPE
jgi:hypothetical protein